MSSADLSRDELRRASSILARFLKEKEITFGIIGGAACALLFLQNNLRYRSTMDVDVIIQADPKKNITAEKISEKMYNDNPQQFAKKDAGYGVFIPAIRITADQGGELLVEVEVFDYESWPNRPQYDLTQSDNNRVSLSVEETEVVVLSPRWLLREKIISMHQRRGNLKEETDESDIRGLLKLVDNNCLTFSTQEQIDALKYAVSKAPDLSEKFEGIIVCPVVLSR